ncbi:MAG: hypothetical protein Q8O53_02340 [Candidatus Moranbacteria bacterium]|nr:hypothetical protein [Candidatus Moranbacteria bacterium]
MGNKAGIIFSLFFLPVLFVSLVVYKKYFIERNYQISAEVPCNQFQEICFVYRCDIETEECASVVDGDTSYYKKIERLASALPACDVSKEGCFIAECTSEDSSCKEVLCDYESVDEECSSPGDFSKEDSSSGDESGEAAGSAADTFMEGNDDIESEE